MNKKVLMMVVGLLLSTVLLSSIIIGCGQSAPAPKPGQTTAPPAPPAAAKTLRFSISYKEGHSRTEMAKRFIELVEAATDGRIQFKLYPGETLLKSAEEFDAISKGSLDMATLLPAYITGKIPLVSLWDGPFSWDYVSAYSIFDELSPVVDAEFAKMNEKFLWGYQIGNLYAAHKSKLLKTVEDYKGTKMRTSGGVWTEWIKQLGGAPVTLTVGEIYTALQTGVTDGTMISAETYLSLSLNEVASYLVDSGANSNFMPTVINLDVWKSLSKEDQDTITRISRNVMMPLAHGLSIKGTIDTLAKAKALGVKLDRMSAAEVEKQRKIMAPWRDEQIAKFGDTAKQIVAIQEKYR